MRAASVIFAYLFACLIQYVGNAWFTFDRPIRSRRQVARYVLSIATGLAINTLIVLVLGPTVGMPDFLAVLLASGLVTALNFVVMLTWTFA
jgi:putative flippase GtrA